MWVGWLFGWSYPKRFLTESDERLSGFRFPPRPQCWPNERWLPWCNRPCRTWRNSTRSRKKLDNPIPSSCRILIIPCTGTQHQSFVHFPTFKKYYYKIFCLIKTKTIRVAHICCQSLLSWFKGSYQKDLLLSLKLSLQLRLIYYRNSYSLYTQNPTMKSKYKFSIQTKNLAKKLLYLMSNS